MADYTITNPVEQAGSSPADNGMVAEDIIVTGGSGGSTGGAYTTKYMVRPQRVEGPFSYTISGRVVTLAGTLAEGAVQTARIIGIQ